MKALEGWPAACAVACALVLFLLALTSATTLWDRDEPRFAQAAVEMLSSGNYLVPTFNGELRAQKPILIYWLMATSLRVAGRTERAVRFWSPIGLAVAALATFAIGRRLWSVRVGLLAMTIVVLNPLALVEGTAATTDAVLLGAITASLAIVTESLYRPPGWRDAVGLGAAFAAALLVKGPVGLILPLAIGGTTCWAARGAIPWRRRVAALLAASTAIGLVSFAAWVVPASVATSGRIATEGLVRENLWRALMPQERHGVPAALAFLYYPIVIVAGFAPWVLYLPQAVMRTASPRSVTTRPGALMAAWIAIPLAVFTVAATKLPHYVMPIWPALALIVSATLLDDDRLPSSRAASRAGLVLAVAVGVTLVALLLWVGGGLGVAGAATAGRLTAGLIVVAFAPAIVIHRRRGTSVAPLWLLGSVAVVAVWTGVVLAPVVERAKPVPLLAGEIRRATPDQAPVFAYEFEEPSLVFYTGRRLVPLGGDAAVIAWARQPGAAVLVAPRAAIDRIERAHGSLRLRQLAAHRGWNYANARPIELVAFARPADR